VQEEVLEGVDVRAIHIDRQAPLMGTVARGSDREGVRRPVRVQFLLLALTPARGTETVRAEFSSDTEQMLRHRAKTAV
jgi:hypothetical protein